MRFTAFIFALFFGISSFAAEVPGQLYYKKKDGDVARRDVIIDVPSMGKGEVILKGKGFEWRTDEFWSEKTERGEILFTAAFQTEFMGMQSTIVFQGTYLKGKNEIIYQGNFLKQKGFVEVTKDFEGFRYGGGFSFNFLRDN